MTIQTDDSPPASGPYPDSRTTPRSPQQRRRATAEAFDSTLRIIGWLNALLLICLGVVVGTDGASETWRVLLGTVGALIGAAVGYAQYQILAALGFVCLNVVEWREGGTDATK